MPSEIFARGCMPNNAHPLVETVARASNTELAAIYAFWQGQPGTINVRALAIGIIEREIFERISLDATAALTPGQQHRVMTFARSATTTVGAFERFYVVIGVGGTVWIVYHERQLVRSCPHAIQVDADGVVCGAVDGAVVGRLSRLPIVNIIPLFGV